MIYKNHGDTYTYFLKYFLFNAIVPYPTPITTKPRKISATGQPIESAKYSPVSLTKCAIRKIALRTNIDRLFKNILP